MEGYTSMRRPLILVTGVPRSGTSMVAGVLQICGGSFGVTDKMYANCRIQNKILKPMLHRAGVCMEGQYPFPKDMQDVMKQADPRFKQLVEDIIWQECPGTPIIKNSRLLLTLMVWDLSYPDAKWVIVRRHDEDIINSCLKTSYMNVWDNLDILYQAGCKTPAEGWKMWVNRYLELIQELKDNGVSYKEVYPDKIVDGDFTELQDVVNWLGLKWQEQQAKEFIIPQLWKSIKNQNKEQL